MCENLTPEQRLRRIAELINKGIYLLALKEGWFEHKPKKKRTKVCLRQRQKLIIEYLKSKGKVTNKEVCEVLGVSRDTAHRELKELLHMGLLKTSGRGRSVAYFKNSVE